MVKRRIREKKWSLTERNGPGTNNVKMLAGGTILQVGEEPGDQRDAQRQTPVHAQGLWPLTPQTGN